MPDIVLRNAVWSEQVVDEVARYLDGLKAVQSVLDRNRGSGQTTLLVNMMIRCQSGFLIVGTFTQKQAIIASQSGEYTQFLQQHIATLSQMLSGFLNGRNDPIFWDNTAIAELMPGRVRAMLRGAEPPENPPSENWTWYDALERNDLDANDDSTHVGTTEAPPSSHRVP